MNLKNHCLLTIQRAREVARHSRAVSLIALLTTVATSNLAESSETYGEKLSAIEVVDLVELMENPSSYVDKHVKIAGNIKNVCPAKGCWIEVENPEANISLRVKVEDDVIVFPTEAKGKSVVAEGIFRQIELSVERSRAWLRHRAKEIGERFDESQAVEPLTLYQIEGTGARIADLGS